MSYQDGEGFENWEKKRCYKVPIKKTITWPDGKEFTFRSVVHITETSTGSWVFAKYSTEFPNTYQITPNNPDLKVKDLGNGKIKINNFTFYVPNPGGDISPFKIEYSQEETNHSYERNIQASTGSTTLESEKSSPEIEKIIQEQIKNLYYEWGTPNKEKVGFENSIHKNLNSETKAILESAISVSQNIATRKDEAWKTTYTREIFVEGKPTGKFIEYKPTENGTIETVLPDLSWISIQGFTFNTLKIDSWMRTEDENDINTNDIAFQFDRKTIEEFKLHYIKQQNAILKSTHNTGNMEKGFVMNDGTSPINVINPEKLNKNAIKINDTDIPFIMEKGKDWKETLKLIDLYWNPVSTLIIPWNGQLTEVRVENWALETITYEDKEGTKYNYIDVCVEWDCKRLKGNFNKTDNTVLFYNPDTQKCASGT